MRIITLTCLILTFVWSSLSYSQSSETNEYGGKDAEKIIVQGEVLGVNYNNFLIVRYKKRIFECVVAILDSKYISCYSLKY